MGSNKTYHYLFKYSFLIFGVLVLTTSIVSWFSPESITVNGRPGARDIMTTTIFALVGIVLVLLFIVVKDKFAVEVLRGQSITILQSNEEKVINWIDIEEISQIQFVHPPLYKMKIKDDDSTIWFNTQANYTSIGGFVND